MEVKVINGLECIRVTKEEFIKLAERWNREIGEDDYDIQEIRDNFPNEMIITEDMCDEYEGGFIMYSDHFHEIFTEHLGRI